ncbi:VOC family protein [Amycolatopsis acidiphila]|uniref:Glyoxalase n=1 Tax=Amycolatopsis acidiphila TaxID=715473 RepID=A0A558AI38_9PSEU|nr:VOC family protein [Amycolatopsis acidiphila]TVT23920.1 glyoxalase [Amycolatopsis acidiphila]UIJ61103.1 VOC family protein [Amycolatopsis acidiphila]GHG86758.1 glyoxalase [Amycolatopsis acidiphila]
MDYRLELIPLPVTDVDRAKAFYADRLGFGVDLDFSPNEAFRVVQLTPPGSACSIVIGVGVVGTPPGSVQGLHLVVDDIRAARAELAGRGVEVAEVADMSAPGKSTVSYAAFTDPDGNGWTLQQLPRL